jgi:hypothetical protein
MSVVAVIPCFIPHEDMMKQHLSAVHSFEQGMRWGGGSLEWATFLVGKEFGNVKIYLRYTLLSWYIALCMTHIQRAHYNYFQKFRYWLKFEVVLCWICLIPSYM